MKRNINKFMTVLLALLLVFGTVPAFSFALSDNLSIEDPGADEITSIPGSLDNGEIWVDKSVEYVENGEFKITLRAIGRNLERKEESQAEPVDVVLVLDVSGSMKDHYRLSSMQTAAKEAVDTLLKVDGNRVAIIKYSEYAEKVSDFDTNASSLKNSINFVANGGTNIQNAFFKAQELIENRSNKTNKPVIILMSDGEPTYYYNSLDNHNSRQGNGTANDNNRNKCVWPTIKQAMRAKDAGIEIYTIGIGTINNDYAIATLAPTEDNTKKYRGDKPFDHKYWEKSTVAGNSADSIIAALAEMVSNLVDTNPLLCTSTETKCYNDLVVTDELGDNFEIISSSLPDDSEGVVLDDGVLSWTLNGKDLATLPAEGEGSTVGASPNEITFTVRIKDEAVAGGPYYTNTTASAVFTKGDYNEYYEEEEVTQPLSNNGWLTLVAIPIADKPGIKVVKTVEKDSAVLVDGKASFDYTVTVTNTGNVTLSGIKISDVMDGGNGVTYDPKNEDGSIKFSIPDELAPGETISFGYKATVYESGEYENTVEVSADYEGNEGEPVSDSSTAKATVKAAGLSIIKSVIGSSEITGNSGTFSYELRIRNDGDMGLKNVTVTDVFDKSGVTYEYDGDLDFDEGVFEIGELPANSDGDTVIQYEVHIDSTGTYTNTATVKGCYQEEAVSGENSENGDGICLEDSDSATVTVKKKSSPSRPPVTPSDPKPPVVVIPDEPTPEGPAEPEIIIPDEEIPEGPALPQTGGGIDPAMLYGLGILLTGGGLGLRFRRNK